MIVASDEWTEITAFDTNYKAATSGITPVVTDVLAVNGAIYFAMGDSQVMTRVYAYNNSGVWTFNFSDFGTYTAGSVTETGTFTYLGYASDENGTYVWGAKGGCPSTIAYASAIDATGWAGTGESALSFSAAINVGDLSRRIRGLEVYDKYGNLHILKEDSVHQIINKKPYKIDIREMENTTDYRTGMAHCVHGVYLYFSWHNSIMRYYNGLLDRISPDKEEVGYPTENRTGHFTSLVGYPGLLIGSIDAGTSGISSVQAYNGKGWCEYYRSYWRIQSIYIQSIPGDTVDRLWMSVGSDIIWIPLSIDPFNHPGTSYLYCTNGNLITSWMYLGLQDVGKLFNSITMISENVGTDETVTISYQKDNDTTWTDVTGTIDTFTEELSLASTPSITGKRIRFKFTLLSADGADTPRIMATVLEAIIRVPVKYYSTLTFLIQDNGLCLDGITPDDYISANDKMNALDTMLESTTPATITAITRQLDGRTAFVDSISYYPSKIELIDGTEAWFGQMRLIET